MISIAYPPHDGEIFKPNNIKNGFSVVKTLMDKYTTNFGTKAGKELEIDDQQKTLLQALIKDI
jgi:3-isopropylmalate dehydratase small subunit